MSRRRDGQEDAYFRILRFLQVESEVTQRDIANKVGLSLGGLNYCLNALVAKGWVKVRNFTNSRNKLQYAYLLTPAGVKEKAVLTTRFIERKMREYEALREELESLEKERAMKGRQ